MLNPSPSMLRNRTSYRTVVIGAQRKEANEERNLSEEMQDRKTASQVLYNISIIRLVSVYGMTMFAEGLVSQANNSTIESIL